MKALSPGINDPSTAVHALGHVSALLCELSGRDLGDRLLLDDRAGSRVVLHRPSLVELLDVAVAQSRRYGATDPSVLGRLFVLLRELAWCADPGQREAIVDQLALLRATTAAGDVDPGAQAWAPRPGTAGRRGPAEPLGAGSDRLVNPLPPTAGRAARGC